MFSPFFSALDEGGQLAPTSLEGFLKHSKAMKKSSSKYLQPQLTSAYVHVASLITQLVKNPPAMQVDPGSILGSGRSPGEGIGYSLQYSGLENSRDCIVMGSQRVGRD